MTRSRVGVGQRTLPVDREVTLPHLWHRYFKVPSEDERETTILNDSSSFRRTELFRHLFLRRTMIPATHSFLYYLLYLTTLLHTDYTYAAGQERALNTVCYLVNQRNVYSERTTLTSA
jgi:hypothetical protein